MLPKRNEYLDIVKGIAMILVFLGHAIQQADAINCYDNIIFDGEINKYNKSNNGYTSILFTCDLNITKDIKENELSGYENEMKNQLSNIYLYTNSSEGDDQSERGMYKTVKYEGGIMMIIN